jgi:hypothetical protein
LIRHLKRSLNNIKLVKYQNYWVEYEKKYIKLLPGDSFIESSKEAVWLVNKIINRAQKLQIIIICPY